MTLPMIWMVLSFLPTTGARTIFLDQNFEFRFFCVCVEVLSTIFMGMPI